MKLLFILALVAVGLVLLSLIRVGVWVTYGPEGPTLRIKVGPVKLSLFPPKEKKRKKKRKAKPEKPEQLQKKGELLPLVRWALPTVAEAAGRLKRKVRLDRVYLDVAVGAGNPAGAALAFGGVNAALGMIWPLVEQNFNVKDRRIRTQVDFSAPHTTVWADVAATLTVGQGVALALWLAPKLPRILNGEQRKQQKQAVQKEAV